MEPTTFYQMMNDIILSLKTQGFKKVAILQCHGGIFIMNPLVRDLNAKYNPDLMVALVDAVAFFGPLHAEGLLETEELHAGECETSQMLAIAPETVDMDKAVDFIPGVPRPYLNYGSIFRASPSGVWGIPSAASAEKVRERNGYQKKNPHKVMLDAAPEARIANFDAYKRIMTEAEALAEAARCLNCGCGEGCQLCKTICTDFAPEVAGVDTMRIKKEECVACGMCYNRCPNGNIEMVNLGYTV